MAQSGRNVTSLDLIDVCFYTEVSEALIPFVLYSFMLCVAVCICLVLPLLCTSILYLCSWFPDSCYYIDHDFYLSLLYSIMLKPT